MIKTRTWRRLHKWGGLIMSFFLVLFCLSGVVLNHRSSVQNWNINRSLLPPSYRFEKWDKGFLRGTQAFRLDGRCQVLLYGYEGCWLTDSVASSFTDFNRGLPVGRDGRSLRSVVQTPNGHVFAAGQFALYTLSPVKPYRWLSVPLPLSGDERISDMTCRGDTLLVTGRSYLYLAVPPYDRFQRIELKAPDGFDGRVSLFRTVWLLHSGELFGVAGRILLDIIALCLIVICVTGWVYWLLPRRKKTVWRRRLLRLHNKIGVKTIVLTLFVAITGWCLRPPVLIALVKGRVSAIPGTSLDASNPWNDNLRMLRYDARSGEWLLSASDGFYRLHSLQAIPEKIETAPPVSVMGLNVWKQDEKGIWLVGSFSGMFRWDRRTGHITDYWTGRTVSPRPGPPFGAQPVAGFTADFHHRPYVVGYESGSDFAPMPEAFSSLPISLWDVALEVHSGRIYVYNNIGSMIFIFAAGFLVVGALWSGYRIRMKK